MADHVLRSASFRNGSLFLVAGKNVRRCKDPKPLPFLNGKRVCRSIRLDCKSDKLSAALEELHVSPLGLTGSHILGAIDAAVGFAYSHSARLSELDREQYWYWRSMGVPASELWCFRVQHAAELPEPLDATHYIPKRFSRVYTVLKHESAREVALQYDVVPDWIASELCQLDGEEDGMHLGLLCPERIVQLCLKHAFDFLLLPAPHSKGWWSPPRWLYRRFNPDLREVFEAGRAEHVQPDVDEFRGFSLQDCGQLAEDLRFCLDTGLPGHERILAQWIGHLQEREDSLQVYAKSDRLAVYVQLIELVMLAERLRNTSQLHEVMQRSLRIVLPQDLHEMADTMLQSRVQKLDKGRISRAHLTLDVGYMLYSRICNETVPEKVRYLMWDSSPQFGRDYQMCLLQEVDSSHLSDVCLSFCKMSQLWHAEEEIDLTDKGLLQQDADYMKSLRSKIRIHALPTVLIGFGAASFGHKLSALLHSARLEVFTNADLKRWCESLVSVASDYGVERRLADVRDLPADEVACWFEDTSREDIELLVSGPHHETRPEQRVAQAIPQDDDPAFEDPGQALQVVDVGAVANDGNEDFDVPEPLPLSFDHLLSVPGLLHVIDNATKGLSEVMEQYHTNIGLAQQVCRLLRKRDTKPKLMQRCFSRGLGPQLAPDIHKFEGWIHPGRWGTVAFSIPELLKVKQALVTCWDENVYLQGNDAQAEESQRRAAAELARDVSVAVHDPSWWGWLSMLEVVCSLLRKHMFWAESCPCHYHILVGRHDDLSPELKRHFASCPMRGKRAAELSEGSFLDLLGQLWALSTVEVLRVVPADVEQAKRRSIVQEFDRARAHLAFYFAVKLSHLQAMPWKVFQIAHTNEVIAQLALREALTSSCRHPVLQQLQGPLRRSCEGWLEGESLLEPDKVDLQKFIASLRLVPTSERAVEGQHAKVHRQGLGRPNHTEHMQSYFVRCKEMAESLEDKSLSMESFAWCCQNAGNHHKACRSVGLAGHPQIDWKHKHRRRNTMNSRVIYHADAFTLYSASTPAVNMRPPPEHGRRLQDADHAVVPPQDDNDNAAPPEGQFSGFPFVSRSNIGCTDSE